MWLAEIHEPLVFGSSDKKHYKKSGTDFLRTEHTSSDAIEAGTLTEEKIPNLTPKPK